MIEEEEAALVGVIRFALRGFDPWPPKGSTRPSEECARKVLAHLRLCGWEIYRPVPKKAHATP